MKRFVGHPLLELFLIVFLVVKAPAANQVSHTGLYLYRILKLEILHYSFVYYSIYCLRALSCALCVKTCSVLLEFLGRQCDVIHYAPKINSTSWPFQEKLQYFLIPECNIVLSRYQCDKINVSFSNVNHSALHLYKSLGGYPKPPDKKGQLGCFRSAFLNSRSQSTEGRLHPVIETMARIFRNEQIFVLPNLGLL